MLAEVAARAVVEHALDPRVHRALAAQAAALAPSAARDANLERLAGGAACVVTGQQVGLFLGPLYTLYKAASAVALAKRIGAVPVFWLQTEDHDVVEIARCGVRGRHEVAALELPVDAANKVSIAHLRLPPEIDACVERLAQLIGDGEHATAHLARVRRHYRAGAPWAAAFAGLLGELFAPEGLLVIDPRTPELAAVVAPLHARALDARIELPAGPIHVRPGAPLAFFHPDGPEGPRVRLDHDLVEVGGTRRFTRAELHAALARDPLAVSTSALLRPLVQDTLLPTAAYVGGPAELAYYAQLAPLYRAFDRPPPLAVPRARFQIVDERARALLARLGLTAQDAMRPEHELLARLARPDLPDVRARLLEPFLAAHAELAGDPAGGQPALGRALAKTKGTVERAIGKLADTFARAASYRDQALVDDVRRLQSWLAPGGAPQERVLGLSGFAARTGDRDLVERVLAAIEPCDPTLKELS